MFWNRKPKSPITKEDEEWIITSYDWFEKTFALDLAKQEVYLPSKGFLNFQYTGSEEDAISIVNIVAGKLFIDTKSTLEVYFFEEFQPIEFTDEGIYSNDEEGSQLTDGLYSKIIDGVYQIGIERSLLQDPVKLIATIAHELAHIKLLGENRLAENDEFLTDLTASLFGFVVFLANGSIKQMTTWSGTTHSGWKIGGGSGYLHYKIYAFLIAYWLIKREQENAEWIDILNKEIIGEVKKSLKYLKSKR